MDDRTHDTVVTELAVKIDELQKGLGRAIKSKEQYWKERDEARHQAKKLAEDVNEYRRQRDEQGAVASKAREDVIAVERERDDRDRLLLGACEEIKELQTAKSDALSLARQREQDRDEVRATLARAETAKEEWSRDYQRLHARCTQREARRDELLAELTQGEQRLRSSMDTSDALRDDLATKDEVILELQAELENLGFDHTRTTSVDDQRSLLAALDDAYGRAQALRDDLNELAQAAGVHLQQIEARQS